MGCGRRKTMSAQCTRFLGCPQDTVLPLRCIGVGPDWNIIDWPSNLGNEVRTMRRERGEESTLSTTQTMSVHYRSIAGPPLPCHRAGPALRELLVITKKEEMKRSKPMIDSYLLIMNHS